MMSLKGTARHTCNPHKKLYFINHLTANDAHLLYTFSEQQMEYAKTCCHGYALDASSNNFAQAEASSH